MDQQHRFRCSYQGPRAGRLCRNRETRSGSIAQTKALASTWAVFESSRLPCFPGLADFLFHVQTTKPCKSRSQDSEVPTEWGEKPPKSRLVPEGVLRPRRRMCVRRQDGDMVGEPLARELGDARQRSRLFEEMGAALYDLQTFFAAQFTQCLPIEIEGYGVV